MAPRVRSTASETNPNPRQGVPPISPGVQDHNFHTQAVFEIHKEVGKLEAGLKSVEDRLSRVEVKLDSVATNLTELKTNVDAVRPFLKSIAVGIWSVAGSIGVFGLTMAGYWLKHHFGW